MPTIRRVLALWEIGLATDADVRDCAAEALRHSESPDDDLIELTLYGPHDCLNRPSADFALRPEQIGFGEEFALRAQQLDLANDDAVDRFCIWAAHRAITEDLSSSAVRVSYIIDHLLYDCQDPLSARQQLRTQLPSLLAALRIEGGV